MRSFRLVLALAMMAVLIAVPAQAQGKSITVMWPQEPDTLSPLYTSMTYGGYSYQLYLAGAWALNKELEPVPVLVTEVPSIDNGGISEDGTTFTLHLKEGMTWSDGDPLDSADFKFTYDMILNDANAVATRNPYDRATLETPDATTVIISFEQPYAPWLGLFSFVLPEHVLRPAFEAEGTLDTVAFNRAPSVSSGPYVFDVWEGGQFMRWQANDSYVLGRPIIDTMVTTFVVDEVAYNANLIAGDAHVGTFVAFSDVPALEEAGLFVEVIPSGYNEGWYLNTSPERAHPAMSDVRVRRAIAMAFDRDTFNRDLNYGATYTPSSFWENTPFDNPDLTPYPYDPEAAAALLDEAGWVDTNGDGTRDKDGEELVLRFITNQRQIRIDLQAIAQQQLAEVGIGTELINYPSDIFFSGYAEGGPMSIGDYDIGELSTSPSTFPDPDTTRFMCAEIPSDENPSGINDTYYCDPELDALFEAQASETDLDARIAIYHEIDVKMKDAAVWIGIWHDADVWIQSPRLINANINAVTPFWDVQNWDIAAD